VNREETIDLKSKAKMVTKKNVKFLNDY